LLPPTADHDQISVVMQSSGTDYARRATALEADFEICFRSTLKHANALASPFQKVSPELRVPWMGRPDLGCRHRMNKAKVSSITASKFVGIPDQSSTLWHKIDRTQDVL
jgi:hypothetical protein